MFRHHIRKHIRLSGEYMISGVCPFLSLKETIYMKTLLSTAATRESLYPGRQSVQNGRVLVPSGQHLQSVNLCPPLLHQLYNMFLLINIVQFLHRVLIRRAVSKYNL